MSLRPQDNVIRVVTETQELCECPMPDHSERKMSTTSFHQNQINDSIEQDSLGYIKPSSIIFDRDIPITNLSLPVTRQRVSSSSDDSETIVKSDAKYESLVIKQTSSHQYVDIEC